MARTRCAAMSVITPLLEDQRGNTDVVRPSQAGELIRVEKRKHLVPDHEKGQSRNYSRSRAFPMISLTE
jgi:hypothetical protein